MNQPRPPMIALACGGTGGHLFPGLAVAEVLQHCGCEIALLVSQKDVDQEAVKSALAMRVLTLPAVALQNRGWSSFLRGSWQSYRSCRKSFAELRPLAVLAMGGFTSAPPVLAGKRLGAATFLHESNSVPGRANRWLSPWVDEVFIGFPSASRRLYNQTIRCVGTPVRSQFKPSDSAPARMALGLDPQRPVLLVMGGSQGATGINRLMQGAIPLLTAGAPALQYLHLTGTEDGPKLQAAYAAHQARAVVRPFLTEMDLALGAATVAVNRAGASSLAELAAMRLPALLVPYPHATDNHQFHNARALVESGAALMLDQTTARPDELASAVFHLLADASARAAMQQALQQWYSPNAAEEMAGHIFARLGLAKPNPPAVDSFRLSDVVVSASKPWKGGTFKLSPAAAQSQK
jgi:UDP-N-acetylglucosamine--N-acetylmuramyl-(pentapeptide) pyrophosphoryl-undecaprenol N-acetylglucosamine transferase